MQSLGTVPSGSAPACPQLPGLRRASSARGVTVTPQEGTPQRAQRWLVPSAPRVKSSSKLVPLLPHTAREQSLARCRDIQSWGQVSRSSETSLLVPLHLAHTPWVAVHAGTTSLSTMG